MRVHSAYRVAEVGVVRRAVVHHCLVDRVRRLVREDARRQARHHFANAALVRRAQHVVVHREVRALRAAPHKQRTCTNASL